MKRLAFAVGVLALGLVATAPAHADYAIVKFKNGYCRIWDHTAVAPPYGHFPLWRSHHLWYYRLPTVGIAHHKLHQSFAWHRCWHPW